MEVSAIAAAVDFSSFVFNYHCECCVMIVNALHTVPTKIYHIQYIVLVEANRIGHGLCSDKVAIPSSFSIVLPMMGVLILS